MAIDIDKERKNRFTGQLSVKISIDRKRIGVIQSQYIHDCFFIEDIFTPYIKGKLVFVDVDGFLEQGPFTGDEILSLVYGNEEEREIVFHIWEVRRILQTTEANSTTQPLIEIVFVDETYYLSMARAISYSFQAQTKYTDMVNYILKNMLGWEEKNINLEACKNSCADAVALPYWPLMKSIKFLLRRAKSSKTNTNF